MKNLLLLVLISLIATALAPVGFSQDKEQFDKQEKEQIKRLVKKADLIVQAKFVETKSRPGHWCCGSLADQEMVYNAEDVIKGFLVEKQIIVDHSVVYNSRTADKNIPQLSEELFQPGRKFILFLRVDKREIVEQIEEEEIRDSEGRLLRPVQVGKDKILMVQIEVEADEDPADRPFRYRVFDENIGALSYSEDKEKLVRKYVKRKNLK